MAKLIAAIKEIGKAFGVTCSAVSKSAQDMERMLKRERKIRRDIELLVSYFKVYPVNYINTIVRESFENI